ncbi:MAG: 2-hydroxychromene-2-carboxylate isomerase [Gammaproteobacteria bacterium]
MKKDQAVFYFSLRSPYSWLAWRDLRDAHPERLAELELVPFWEPDARHDAQLLEAGEGGGEGFLYRPMSRDKHMYILADVRALASERGLAIKWPIDREPRWEVAHHAYFIALRHGRGHDYIDAVCNARWQQGLDISDPQVIASIAAGLGVPAEEAARAHEDEAIRAEGLAALRRCVKDGVFGVPFFISGRAKFWGLDRLPRFLAARQAAAPQPEPEPEPEPVPAGLPGRAHPAIFDHAGGCG